MRFAADDMAIISENEKDLEKLIRIVDETFNKDISMKINVQQIKIYSYVEGKIKPEYRIYSYEEIKE